ncbi:MAG TPA: DUF4412 domain-containing protein [Candidatus Binataceae bacterium]|nr:DUF4412 domain-containing protein [Candidatus Binataceae bacterium]
MALAFAVAGGGFAQAGVVITMQNGGTAAEPAGKGETMYLDQNRLKVSTARGGMIFRDDLHKVWNVDEEHHSYHELNPDTMKQMQAEMEQARQQMEQRLHSMPPEQRARIEAMLAQQGLGDPSKAKPLPPVTYEKAGPDKTVGKWSCTPYRVKGAMLENEEFCIAPLKELGLTRDDLKPFIALGDFMKQMPMGGRARSDAAFNFDAQTKAIGFEGLPVQTMNYGDNGKIDYQTTITSVQRESIAAETFEIPAGYTKQEIPMGRPPGAHAP